MAVRKRKWRTEGGEYRESWIVVYRDRGGIRRTRTFERKKDADAYEATVRVDLRAGIHTSSRETVSEAGDAWLSDLAAKLEPATTESYRQHLRDHINPYLGDVRLADLTVPTVRSFMDDLRADDRSPAMIKRVVGDLGSILADAQERGTIAQNVVRGLSKRNQSRRKVEQRQKRRLEVGKDIPSPAEIRAIIARLSGFWRPLLLTAIFTGLRASELRGLVWDSVDLKRNELHVRQRADKFNTMGPPKTVAGQRTVPLPPILVNTLREWRLACPPSELGLVFPTGAGQIEYHSNIVTRGLAPVQIAAGVVTTDGKPKYTGLHALRHFYASWCINRKEDGGLGLPLKMVQHRLGHSNIQVTADTYGHLFPSTDAGAELAAAQNALLG
jgi:integrase